MKIFVSILRIIGTLILAGVIGLCLFVAAPKLVGLQVYAVISGSMEPTIPTGSLVCVETVAPEELNEEDIIAFYSDISGGGVITHRVISIDTESQSLITKGDANEAEDVAPVFYEQLVGRVKVYVPWLGSAALFLSKTKGKLMVGGLILLAVLLHAAAFFLNRTDKQEADQQETDKQETDKKKSSGVVIVALLCIGILLMGVAAVNIYRILNDYHSSNQLYSNLESEYVESVDTDITKEVPWYEMISVDIAGLRAQNEDVKGWIYFENEDISYPVLYSGDDDTYLRRTMDKQKATAGSIFIEGMNNPDFEDSHTLIYGHHMRNLSMFGKLTYYKEDPDYYIDHMYFQIITSDAVYRYKIFAYEDVEPDSYVYTVPYAPNEDFAEFIDSLYAASYRQTGVAATQDDKVITLSTCGTTSGKGRFVVHAVRVDEHKLEEIQHEKEK